MIKLNGLIGRYLTDGPYDEKRALIGMDEQPLPLLESSGNPMGTDTGKDYPLEGREKLTAAWNAVHH
ncbi:MAG: hypothetical protein LBC51_01885 [Treponema sp.]|nr:hypothetical protein [Treponema sp.]